MVTRRPPSIPMKPENVRVIIVGAGMAGLSAAEKLFKYGFTNTIILEASNRIGGRIHTVHFGSRPTDTVELGGQYIGGVSDDCSTYTLAKQCGLVDQIEPDQILDRPSSAFYRYDGKAIDAGVSAPAYRLFESWYAEVPQGHPSAEEYLTKRYAKEISLHFNKEQLDDVRCVFNHFLTFILVDQGAHPGEVSMPPSEGYVDLPGGYIKVPGGLTNIVTEVAKNIPKHSILLQNQVNNISWGLDPIAITCAGGRQYLADHVIVTCPLGVLKSNDLFVPGLPVEKTSAIASLGFGKIGKIFLLYDRPFWYSGQRRIAFAWSNYEYSGKGYPKKEWWKYMEGVDTVLGNPNTLVCWVGGSGAEVMETLPEEELVDTCTSILRNFLAKSNIPRANRCIVSRWNTSPYTRGVYSYIKMGSGPAHMEALARSLGAGGVPRLLFAGEATIVTGQGFMHGARDSGIREADKILEYYGINTKSKL